VHTNSAERGCKELHFYSFSSFRKKAYEHADISFVALDKILLMFITVK
jgi:hypothetical protein